MRFSHASAMAASLVCIGLASTPAQARWEQLGCQKVGFLVDRDVIRVGRSEGKFKAIRLRVMGNKIY